MLVKTWPFKTYSALPAEFTFVRTTDATYYSNLGDLTVAVVDEPRFDHDPDTLEPLGYKTEGQRTNDVKNSYFETGDETDWVTHGAEATATNVVAGALQGLGSYHMAVYRIAGAGVEGIKQVLAGLTNATTYTLSVYVANVTGGSPEISTTFGLASQALVSGWNSFSFTTTSTGGDLNIYSAAGAIGLGFDFGYVQLELGSFKSSFIPTVANAETRAGDFAKMGPVGGLPFVGYNALEGTFVVDWDSATNSMPATQYVLNVNDSTTGNRLVATLSSAQPRIDVRVGGASQVTPTLLGPAIAVNTTVKTTFAYKLNDYSYGGDGQPPRGDTAALVPSVDRVNLGVQQNANNLPLWGHISKLTYFDERLPDTSLVYLTLPVRTLPRTLQTLMQAAIEETGKTASSQLAMQAASEGVGITASAQLSILVAHYPDLTESIRNTQLMLQAATADLTGKTASGQQSMLVAYRTGTVENLLSRAWTFTLDGHTFYVITLGEQGTYVFDRTTEQWSQWRTYGMPVWNMEIGTTWKGNIIAADQSNPVIWELEPRSFLDDDFKPMQRVVTGGLPVRGRDYVENYAFRITASLGKFDLPTTVPATIATVRLRFSDDQGKTFTDMGTLTMKAGDWVQELAWTSLGSMHSPGRLFEVSDEGAVTRIDDADAENGE